MSIGFCEVFGVPPLEPPALSQGAPGAGEAGGAHGHPAAQQAQGAAGGGDEPEPERPVIGPVEVLFEA